MQAEFIAFNGDWHKDCSQCGGHFGGECKDDLAVFFARDAGKIDGLDSVCKSCRKRYRQANKTKELARWKKTYAPKTEARKRAMVRSQTRRKYGSAHKLMCTKCKVTQASEWHHVIYTTDGAVPLCGPCHELM
jgi:hypothetical protein